MSRLSCSFCSHANPERSKFCNECGSPLNLVPCSHCEAINNVADRQCCRCGAPLFPAAESPLAAEPEHATQPTEARGAADTGLPGTEDRALSASSIPISLAERLGAASAPLARASDPPGRNEPQWHDDPALGARDANDVEEAPLPHRGLARDYGPRHGYQRHAVVLVLLLLGVAGALYWSSMEPSSQPPPRVDTGRPAAVATPAVGASAAGTGDAVPTREHGPNASPSTSVVPETASGAPDTATAPQPEPSAPSAAVPGPVPPMTRETPETTPAREAAAPQAERAVPSTPQPAQDAAGRADRRGVTELPGSGPSRAASRASADAPRRSAAHVRTPEEAERDALATQRLIARDLGTVPRNPARAPAASPP